MTAPVPRPSSRVRRPTVALAVLAALLLLGTLAQVATGQVLVKACVPDYGLVSSLTIVNARSLTPPLAVPTATPAGMQLATIVPAPTRTPNTVACGPDANTGYVEQTVPTLGGPGVKIQLAGWSCSADAVCSTRSNVLVGVPIPLAAPALVP